jgi:hypothetical protein
MPNQKERPLIYQLKVELAHIEPVIWRRFLVPSIVSLHRLHLILQDVMGWTNSHLYQFKIGEKEYGEPDPDDESNKLNIINSRKTKLNRVIPPKGSIFIYEYDFGDGWIHNITVEDVLELSGKARYPICLDGERACPPEDSGGPFGYPRLLAIAANPDNEEYEEIKNWLGRTFRPSLFSLQKVNRRLKPISLVRPE